MKNTRLFFLFLLGVLMPVLAKAQFDEAYLGYYENEDATMYCFIATYNDEDYGFLELTEDQKKNCAFVFGCQNSTDLEAIGIAMKKGSGYASVVTGEVPALNFVFKFDGTSARSIEITDKTGKKYLVNQLDLETVYQDEEYSDEEMYTPYTDEEMEYDMGLDIRGYQRSDGASLSVIFAVESSCAFMLTIPATKSCPEIMIEGAFEEPFNEEGVYTYKDPEGNFVMKIKQGDGTMQFECVSGDCFDKKGKCGIWKEAFVQGD